MYKLTGQGLTGVQLFNSGEYFECHDMFEDVWRTKEGEERAYYQGLIQIAVALYKINTKPTWRGATALLRKGSGLLKSVEPENVELDIPSLIDESLALLARLEEAGPDRLAEFKNEKFPQLKFRPGHER